MEKKLPSKKLSLKKPLNKFYIFFAKSLTLLIKQEE